MPEASDRGWSVVSITQRTRDVDVEIFLSPTEDHLDMVHGVWPRLWSLERVAAGAHYQHPQVAAVPDYPSTGVSGGGGRESITCAARPTGRRQDAGDEMDDGDGVWKEDGEGEYTLLHLGPLTTVCC